MPANKKLGVEEADAFSKACITWTNGLLSTAYARPITEKDMPSLHKDFSVDFLSESFNEQWASIGGKGGAWSLARILFRINAFKLIAIFSSEIVENLLGLASPILLSALIKFVNDYQNDEEKPALFGFYIAIMLFIVQIARTFAMNILNINEIGLLMGIKGLAYGVLLRKSLKFSPKSREDFPSSHIMNILSVDVAFLMEALIQVQNFLTAPFQIVLCFITLYKFLGNAVWVGAGLLLILSPVTAWVSEKFNNMYRDQMAAKDKRVKLTSSILSNAKSLKLYAWEKPFFDKLDNARNEVELGIWRTVIIIWSGFQSLYLIIPYAVATSSFYVFLKTQDKPLTADIVFPCLSLFSYLSKPLSVLPDAVMSTIQSKVSFTRVSKVLSAPEKSDEGFEILPPARSYSDETVSVRSNLVKWSEDEDAVVALKDLKFSAKKGDLVSIVGKVGTGKTAFLLTLCGLTSLSEDSRITLRGNIAYVPQEPWLLNQSVKENIIFGNRFDPEFYQRTLDACCLMTDIENFPDGDETEIGEKGVTLSGGQKARVSLARAVYARADIYILDDVLSAVDEHVGKHLVDNVLGHEGVLQSKTRILATNSIKVLSESSSIYMIEDQTFVEHGSLKSVMQKKEKIYKLIKEFGKNDENALDDVDLLAEEIDHEKLTGMNERRASVGTLRRASVASFNQEELEDSNAKIFKKTAKIKEGVEVGSVKKDVFIRYFRSTSITIVTVSLIAVILSCAVQMAANIWLKYMSQQDLTGTSNDIMYFMGVYFGIGLLVAAFYMLSFLAMIVRTGLAASRKLHNQMMWSVLRSPMTFFETTPMGQVLNRFTNDVGELDMMLPDTIFEFFMSIGKLSCSILIVVAATPVVLIFAFPLSFLYLSYQKFYIPCTRQLKRISSSSRSPLLSHMEESLKGANVIVTFDKSNNFIRANDLHADLNLSTVFLSQTVDRWLAMRLNFLGDLIALSAAFSGVFLTTQNRMTSSLMGLVMANALEISGFLSLIVQWMVRLELRGVTLERIMEYIDLPSEAPDVIENNRPSAAWPVEGNIKFENYSAKYRENLDPVLKGINLDIKRTEKIGIVGRTGAGKSTLTLALFRIIEAAGGQIDIDGTVTKDIGLFDLRSRLSIIPQDAQIFEGSVRDNIDPHKEYSESQLWDVLEICHLKKHVEGMGDGLDSALVEGGGNLSRGQAQLICLARALLHQSNILVLDEATASVDVETDAIIQQTIRSEFKHKTIITIAHRLNTIMDSDRIAVLELGEVAEFDTPAKLLENEESLFYSLCEKGGVLNSQPGSSAASSKSALP